MRALVFGLVGLLAACGTVEFGVDRVDAGDRPDAGGPRPDAGEPRPDAGEPRPDAEVPDLGLEPDAGVAVDGAVAEDAGADAGCPEPSLPPFPAAWPFPATKGEYVDRVHAPAARSGCGLGPCHGEANEPWIPRTSGLLDDPNSLRRALAAVWSRAAPGPTGDPAESALFSVHGPDDSTYSYSPEDRRFLLALVTEGEVCRWVEVYAAAAAACAGGATCCPLPPRDLSACEGGPK